MIALDSTTNTTTNRTQGGSGGFIGGGGGGGCVLRTMEERFPIDSRSSSSSSSSSSIGKNSDSCCDSDKEEEVQSSYKGPLSSLDALEEVLPIRRGISQFYNGKSKSFTSLSDVSSSKELAKPDDAYTRKRKNLIATGIMLGKNRTNTLRTNVEGIQKGPTIFKRRFSHANAACSSESNNSDNSNSSSSPPRLPPLHPQRRPLYVNASMSQQNFSPRRSFSLADLQFSTPASDDTTIPSSNTDEHRELN